MEPKSHDAAKKAGETSSGKKYYVYLSSYKNVKGNKISGSTLYEQTVKVK